MTSLTPEDILILIDEWLESHLHIIDWGIFTVPQIDF